MIIRLMVCFLFIFSLNPKLDMHPKSEIESVEIESFSPSDHLYWQIINDGVMGGLSESQMQISDEETGVFRGKVSLENNGGFASTRALLKTAVTTDFAKVELKVKGDGKRYQLRFRQDQNFDGVSYRLAFDTIDGKWMTISTDLSDFEAVFRGRLLQGQPALKSDAIRQVGFLISDKQKGDFRLEADWIRLAQPIR